LGGFIFKVIVGKESPFSRTTIVRLQGLINRRIAWLCHSIDRFSDSKRATTRVAPTERFVGAIPCGCPLNIFLNIYIYLERSIGGEGTFFDRNYLSYLISFSQTIPIFIGIGQPHAPRVVVGEILAPPCGCLLKKMKRYRILINNHSLKQNESR
jgi:hypothetical protein